MFLNAIPYNGLFMRASYLCESASNYEIANIKGVERSAGYCTCTPTNRHRKNKNRIHLINYAIFEANRINFWTMHVNNPLYGSGCSYSRQRVLCGNEAVAMGKKPGLAAAGGCRQCHWRSSLSNPVLRSHFLCHEAGSRAQNNYVLYGANNCAVASTTVVRVLCIIYARSVFWEHHLVAIAAWC